MVLKFLVVDDDPDLCKLYTITLQMLAEPSPEVRTAATNCEAFRILEDFTPNLIITDIMHSGGSGYDFLTQLRSNRKTKFIPVVAMSGQGRKRGQELRQWRHGFNAVLPKPFHPQEFIDCIERVLDSSPASNLTMDQDLALLRLGFESQGLDYKESVDLKTKDGRAALAKDVIAMANWGGGTIIIGVAEPSPGQFVPMGVSNHLAASCETSRLNRALRDFLDPPIPVTSRRVQNDQGVFIFLEVTTATTSLVLAKRKNERIGLYPGRIYTRTSAAESAEVHTSSELRDLLDRLAARQEEEGT